MSKEITIKAQFTPEQIEIIKNTVARGATDDELKIFLLTCVRTGLDPFTKQVHFIKRRSWNKDQNRYEEIMTIVTGIDGYRSIAERTKQLAGIDDVVYEENQLVNPIKASVTVWRYIGGQRVSFTASARWSEYCPKNNKGEIVGPMWKKMPYFMLGKCAEALALRKAFPNDLSGIYTKEEMDQAYTDDGQPQIKQKTAQISKIEAKVIPSPALATKPQINKIVRMYEHIRDTLHLKVDIKEYLGNMFKIETMKGLTKDKASVIITRLQAETLILNKYKKEQNDNQATSNGVK